MNSSQTNTTSLSNKELLTKVIMQVVINTSNESETEPEKVISGVDLTLTALQKDIQEFNTNTSFGLKNPGKSEEQIISELAEPLTNLMVTTLELSNEYKSKYITPLVTCFGEIRSNTSLLNLKNSDDANIVNINTTSFGGTCPESEMFNTTLRITEQICPFISPESDYFKISPQTIYTYSYDHLPKAFKYLNIPLVADIMSLMDVAKTLFTKNDTCTFRIVTENLERIYNEVNAFNFETVVNDLALTESVMSEYGLTIDTINDVIKSEFRNFISIVNISLASLRVSNYNNILVSDIDLCGNSYLVDCRLKEFSAKYPDIELVDCLQTIYMYFKYVKKSNNKVLIWGLSGDYMLELFKTYKPLVDQKTTSILAGIENDDRAIFSNQYAKAITKHFQNLNIDITEPQVMATVNKLFNSTESVEDIVVTLVKEITEIPPLVNCFLICCYKCLVYCSENKINNIIVISAAAKTLFLVQYIMEYNRSAKL